MRNPQNLFKKRLKEGVQQLGMWHTLPSTTTTELLFTCGYDWVMIDTEHTPIGPTDVLPSLQAAAGYPEVAALVRPVENDTALIKRYLDMGAQTLMIPYVQTPEEAQKAVDAMRYAPRGVRGMGGLMRGSRYGHIDGYAEVAEDELCLIVQVETVEAMERLEEIAAVDGVDAVFIGPADLGASMGYPGQPGHPEVKAEVLRAIGRLKAAGVPSGVLSMDVPFLKDCIAAGTGFTGVAIDMALLLNATHERLAEFKS